MPDVGTGLIVAGVSPVLTKFLGPTAQYLGGKLKDLVKRGAENVERILAAGVRKLGSRIEEPGAVPARVFKEFILEGPFIEDELAAEYFGGILASSRTDKGVDDRAVAYLSLIRSMSVYELRLHYLLYTNFKRIFTGSGRYIGGAISASLPMLQVFVQLPQLVKNVVRDEKHDWKILEHATTGLLRHDLIYRSTWGFGTEDELKGSFTPKSTIQGDGLIACPSPFGTELLLAADGQLNVSPDKFLEPDVAIAPWPEFEVSIVATPFHPITEDPASADADASSPGG